MKVQRKGQQDTPLLITPAGGTVMVTPPIDEDYWSYRVRLTETQAIVAFPKFFTIGIGFAQEEDWNTNLPYTSDPEVIFRHIAHNKGDDSIPDDLCREAIKAIQAAVRHDKEETTE